MTSTQRDILKRLGQFTRNLRFFCGGDGKPGDLAMSAPVAQANLDALIKLGYIRAMTGDTYRITESGRNYLDLRGAEQADYSRLPKETYSPPIWHVREGGDQHLSIRSRGMI